VAVTTGAVLAVSGLAALGGPIGATASSHREAPNISGLPQFDTTDVYAFVSPDKPDTVTLLANWIPFEEPAGGPNFYPWSPDARYDINIDNDGNGEGDITYRWEFRTTYQNRNTLLYNDGPVTSLTDPNLNLRQTYKLSRWEDGKGWRVLTHAGPVAPSNVGKASMPDYGRLRAQAIARYGDTKAFAGQADDPFFLDLRVFDLLYGANLSEVGTDTLAGFNVNTLGVQVPREDLRGPNDGVVGVWSSTARRDAGGTYRQVSRLGSPLVNEVVIPLKDKDRFYASRPVNDGPNGFGPYVTNPELPNVVQAVYGIKAPAEPRNDLVSVFLTGVKGLTMPTNPRLVPSEMLRLNLDVPPTAKPDRLGVIGGDNGGYPNGRRLADDVVDISLQVVEGELVGSPNDLGDAVNRNDVPFDTRFPYVAAPQSGSATNPHQVAGFTALDGGNAPDGASPTPAPAPVGMAMTVLGVATLGAGLYAARRRTASALTTA
jgi:hypothetical protein